MKAGVFFRLMAALVIGLLLILYATSCYSPKKASKQVSKALAYYPEQTIGKVRLLAPCVTLGSSFSTDSAAYKASIDSLYNSRGWYESLIRGLEQFQHDTAENKNCPTILRELELANKKIEVQEDYIIDLTDQFNKIEPIIINRVDTVEDLAKVVEKDLQLLESRKLYSQQTEELTKAKTERDKAKKASNKKTWWMVGEGFSILLLLVSIYFIFKGKTITKII